MQLARINTNGLLDITNCSLNEGAKITKLKNAGFIDFVGAEQPKCESGFIAVETLQVVDGKLVQSWKIEVDTTQS